MPCGWEGNRRSGVALRNRLQWFIDGLRKGDEHPAYAHHRVRHTSLGFGSDMGSDVPAG